MLNSIAALTRSHLFPSPAFLSFCHRLSRAFELSLHTLTWSDYRRSLHRYWRTRRFCANERRSRISSLEAYTVITTTLGAVKPPRYQNIPDSEKHAVNIIPITNDHPVPLLPSRPSTLALHSSNPHLSFLPPNNQTHHFRLENPPLPPSTTPRTPQMALAMPPMCPHLPPRHHAPLPR